MTTHFQPRSGKRIRFADSIFYYTCSFDIDFFVGDGVFWLQIYDSRGRILVDIPYASSRGLPRESETVRYIEQFLHDRGFIHV